MFGIVLDADTWIGSHSITGVTKVQMTNPCAAETRYRSHFCLSTRASIFLKAISCLRSVTPATVQKRQPN